MAVSSCKRHRLWQCAEYTSALAAASAAGNPLPSAQRQRHFDRMSTLEAAVFDPAYVYTFVICQSIVDMPSYR